TGMSADEWIAAAPGTEGILALAMAHVIVNERLGPPPAARIPPADIARIRELVAPYAPEQIAAAVGGGIEGKEIRRLAREFAASGGGLAVAGGIATQYPKGAAIVAPVNILSYVAGRVGGTVRFGPNHSLEQWNDSRPRAGVYALQQPVMQPVFPNARHSGDVLLQVAGKPGTFKDHLRSRWAELHARFGRGQDFETFWTDALQHGGIYREAPTQAVRLGPDASRLPALGAAAPAPGWRMAGHFGLTGFPSIGLHGG